MRKLLFFLLSFFFMILFIAVNGCVISPRRIVGGSTGSGSNSEFSLTASPTTQSVTAGATAVYTVTVQALNSFTGTVSLAVSSSNANVTASLDNPTITGGSGGANLTVQSVAATPTGNTTLTVTGTDTANNVSQSVAVTFAVTSSTATASAAVPAGCIPASAGAGLQHANAATTSGAHGFSATFDATPSSAGLDGSIGLFATATNTQQVFADLIAFTPDNTIQVRNGENFVSSNIAYAAGDTYHFRLVETLPAATYSLFVTPPGGTEIQLGANLQLPVAQQGATAINGWGAQTQSPENARLEVCNFAIE